MEAEAGQPLALLLSAMHTTETTTMHKCPDCSSERTEVQ